jgi:hypothetical protein
VAEIDVNVRKEGAAYLADVTVKDRAITAHRVRVSLAERERYGSRAADKSEASGNDDVAALVRRSFEFLLEREPNTSIMREFSLSTIERYFPEYAGEMRRAETDA